MVPVKLYTDDSQSGWGFSAKDKDGNVWVSGTTTEWSADGSRLITTTYWHPIRRLLSEAQVR